MTIKHLVLSSIFLVASISAAAAQDACVGDPAAAVSSFQKLAVETKPIFRTTSFLPAGASVYLVVPSNFAKGSDDKLAYRALIRAGRPNEPLQDNNPPLDAMVSAEQIAATDSLVTDNVVDRTSTVLNVRIPDRLSSWWQEATVYVFGCKDGTAAFKASITMPVSPHGFSNIIVWSLAILIYGLVCWAVANASRAERPPRPDEKPIPWWRYLDPVFLSAGPYGKGSLSKLQILFFSFIVIALLAYVLLRVGRLSDVSYTVLALIGIAGVGSAAANATDIARRRIDFDNWAWFVKLGWLTEHGLACDQTARWRDIVTSDGEFDVYRFQIVVFSLVVGGALLGAGFSDLSTSAIPLNLLGILGLSQIVYVGGKLATPPSFDELNKAATDLRKKDGKGDPAFAKELEELKIMFVATTGLTIDEDDEKDQARGPAAAAGAAAAAAGAAAVAAGATAAADAAAAEAAAAAAGPIAKAA